jgi:carbamoyl-phosphate synthase large subunit
MNVLITSASRKVGLVRAFQAALRAVGGGRVLAADVSPLVPALYEADGGRLVPRSDDPRFIDAILELCVRDEIRLIIPTRDEELPTFAAARESFVAAGVLVLVSDPDAVETCQDKARFAIACAAAGLATPRVVETPTAADLPLFVRPLRGKGGHGARAVRTDMELAAALEELGRSALVQELVSAPEFTVDLFLDLAGSPISCVPRQRLLVLAGESYVGRTVRDESLIHETIRLVTSIGLVGHVTVQAFRREDEVLFIEINPRYGGGATLGFAAGAQTPEWAVRLALGERITSHMDEYVPDLLMLRYTEDRILKAGELIDPELVR